MPKKIKMFVVPPPDGSAATDAKRRQVRRASAKESSKLRAKIDADALAIMQSEEKRRGDGGGILTEPRDADPRNWPVTRTLEDFGKLIDKKPSFADIAKSAEMEAPVQRQLMRHFILSLRTNISDLAAKCKIEPAQRCDDDPFKEFDLIRLWYAHARASHVENGEPPAADEPTELERARKYLDFANDAASKMMAMIDSWEQAPPDESLYPDSLTYFMDHATSLRLLRDQPFSMATYFRSAGDYRLLRAFTRELTKLSRIRQIENGPIATLDSRLEIMGPFTSPELKHLKMRPPDDPFWIELTAAEAWVMHQQATLRGLVTLKESLSHVGNTHAKPDSAESQTGVADPIILDATDLAILLAGSIKAQLVSDLATDADCHRDTVSDRLPALIDAELMATVTKGNGKRLKYFTTPAGIRRIPSTEKNSA